MAGQRFYYKNVLQVAEEELGDGTVYGSGTMASISTTSKTFTTNAGGVTFIADVTEAADIVNGFLLYFATSKNKYHIVDFESNISGSQDRFTVYEVPSSDDQTAAFEVRAAIVEKNSLTTKPAFFAQDNAILNQHEMRAANVAMDLYVMLPNFLEDGGAEEQTAGNVGGDWTAESTRWQIISGANKLLGSRSFEMTWAGGTNAELRNVLARTLEKNKTYTLLLKAKTVGGNTLTGALAIKIQQNVTPNTLVDTAAFSWNPGIVTTTAAWISKDFSPTFTTEIAQLIINAVDANKSTSTSLVVDEVSIVEKISVERFLAANHTWNGVQNVEVRSVNCFPLRTSFGASDRSSIVAAFTSDGTSTIDKAITATNAPGYHVLVPAVSGKTWKAGLIGIYKQLDLSNNLIGTQGPVEIELAPAAMLLGALDGNIFAYTPEIAKDRWRGAVLLTDAQRQTLDDLWRWTQAMKRPFWFAEDEILDIDALQFVILTSPMLKVVRLRTQWLVELALQQIWKET